MSTVIFVHGTGVRKPVFSRLFGWVRSELRRRRPELGIEPCYWGGAEGARLWHHGHSAPAYDATRGVVPGPDEELALWSLLYQDRLWELRMLAMTRAFPQSGSWSPSACKPTVLYEIGALWSLAHDDPLPAHMPAWLNIYDPGDLLSYVGAPLFPGRVEDVEVNNGQPFPPSHIGYWSNPKVWDAIVSRLP